MAKSSVLSKITSLKSAFGQWWQGLNRRAQRRGVRTEPAHESEAPLEDVPVLQHHDTELPRPSTDLCTDPMLPTGSPQGTQTTVTPPPRGPEFTNSVPGHPLALNTTSSPLGTSTGWPIILNPTSATGCTAKTSHSLCFWPTNPALLGHISEPQGRPTRGGGYSDVWCCEVRFCTPSEGLPTKVAVKVLRSAHLNTSTTASKNEQMLQRFQQEGITWFGLLDHPNIVPLLGWTLTPNLAFVSPWYEQGNLYGQLRSLSGIKKIQILLGIAKGLEYLHSRSPPVVHGDLKPENILLSDQGEPLLTDFGLSTIIGEEQMYTYSHRMGGSVPWMAPECMTGAAKSVQSDIYSFGSLAFTVVTGELPHAGLTDGQITLKVCDRAHPKDPIETWSEYAELEGLIGDLLRDCWSRLPEARPSMPIIIEHLTNLLGSRESQVDGPLPPSTR